MHVVGSCAAYCMWWDMVACGVVHAASSKQATHLLSQKGVSGPQCVADALVRGPRLHLALAAAVVFHPAPRAFLERRVYSRFRQAVATEAWHKNEVKLVFLRKEARKLRRRRELYRKWFERSSLRKLRSSLSLSVTSISLHLRTQCTANPTTPGHSLPLSLSLPLPLSSQCPLLVFASPEALASRTQQLPVTSTLQGDAGWPQFTLPRCACGLSLACVTSSPGEPSPFPQEEKVIAWLDSAEEGAQVRALLASAAG